MSSLLLHCEGDDDDAGEASPSSVLLWARPFRPPVSNKGATKIDQTKEAKSHVPPTLRYVVRRFSFSQQHSKFVCAKESASVKFSPSFRGVTFPPSSSSSKSGNDETPPKGRGKRAAGAGASSVSPSPLDATTDDDAASDHEVTLIAGATVCDERVGVQRPYLLFRFTPLPDGGVGDGDTSLLVLGFVSSKMTFVPVLTLPADQSQQTSRASRTRFHLLDGPCLWSVAHSHHSSSSVPTLSFLSWYRDELDGWTHRSDDTELTDFPTAFACMTLPFSSSSSSSSSSSPSSSSSSGTLWTPPLAVLLSVDAAKDDPSLSSSSASSSSTLFNSSLHHSVVMDATTGMVDIRDASTQLAGTRRWLCTSPFRQNNARLSASPDRHSLCGRRQGSVCACSIPDAYANVATCVLPLGDDESLFPSSPSPTAASSSSPSSPIPQLCLVGTSLKLLFLFRGQEVLQCHKLDKVPSRLFVACVDSGDDVIAVAYDDDRLSVDVLTRKEGKRLAHYTGVQHIVVGDFASTGYEQLLLVGARSTPSSSSTGGSAMRTPLPPFNCTSAYYADTVSDLILSSFVLTDFATTYAGGKLKKHASVSDDADRLASAHHHTTSMTPQSLAVIFHSRLQEGTAESARLNRLLNHKQDLLTLACDVLRQWQKNSRVKSALSSNGSGRKGRGSSAMAADASDAAALYDASAAFDEGLVDFIGGAKTSSPAEAAASRRNVCRRSALVANNVRIDLARDGWKVEMDVTNTTSVEVTCVAVTVLSAHTRSTTFRAPQVIPRQSSLSVVARSESFTIEWATLPASSHVTGFVLMQWTSGPSDMAHQVDVVASFPLDFASLYSSAALTLGGDLAQEPLLCTASLLVISKNAADLTALEDVLCEGMFLSRVSMTVSPSTTAAAATSPPAVVLRTRRRQGGVGTTGVEVCMQWYDGDERDSLAVVEITVSTSNVEALSVTLRQLVRLLPDGCRYVHNTCTTEVVKALRSLVGLLSDEVRAMAEVIQEDNRVPPLRTGATTGVRRKAGRREAILASIVPRQAETDRAMAALETLFLHDDSPEDVAVVLADVKRNGSGSGDHLL